MLTVIYVCSLFYFINIVQVLGKVISSLVKGKSHVPYYESKLTTLLKAAFGGNSRTTVIVNCRSDGDSGTSLRQLLYESYLHSLFTITVLFCC